MNRDRAVAAAPLGVHEENAWVMMGCKPSSVRLARLSKDMGQTVLTGPVEQGWHQGPVDGTVVQEYKGQAGWPLLLPFQ